MRKVIGILAILISCKVNAQNLIPNSGFEEMTTCNHDTVIDFNLGGTSYFYIKDWENPTDQTPDLFTPCFYDSIVFANNCVPSQYGTYSMSHNNPGNWVGFQYPKEGNNYIGLGCLMLTTDGREYISTQLISPLESTKKYCMSAYLSLTDLRRILGQFLCSPPPADKYFTDCLSLNNMQTFISPIAVPHLNGNGPLPYNPQIELTNVNQTQLNDTVNWMLVSGEYTAIGGEQYLYLGNFNNQDYQVVGNDTISILDNFLSYYYIDDVSLFEVKEPTLKADTLVCNGDTATLTIEGDVLEYWWYEQNNPNTILATGPTLKVSPWQTTNYTVKTKSCSVIFEKTVTVTVCNNQPVIKIYPNPAHDFVTINLQNVDLDNSVVSMYNAVGQLVYKETITNNQFSISTAGLAGGLYTLDISQGSQSIARQKVVVLH